MSERFLMAVDTGTDMNGNCHIVLTWKLTKMYRRKHPLLDNRTSMGTLMPMTDEVQEIIIPKSRADAGRLLERYRAELCASV